MAKIHRPSASPLPLVPLLITESEEEFNRISQGFYHEIKPVGIIECMYVDEIVDIVWQIIRLKAANRRHQFGISRCLGGKALSSYASWTRNRARMDF